MIGRRTQSRELPLRISCLLLGLAVAAAGAAAAAAETAAGDSALVLQGEDDGTVFRSLTVEAENRIRLEFARPALDIELDARSAPGLVLGSAAGILDRTVPDLVSPLLDTSRHGRSPYLPRPWLAALRAGPVACFRPRTRGVESWTLTVADSRGDVVRVFTGDGEPPDEIAWDGLDAEDHPVQPGLTCSYVFEARDRAGNKRRLVGEGFAVPGFRLEGVHGPVFAVPGGVLPAEGVSGQGGVPPLVLEIASWLNRRISPLAPLRIVATARSGGEAEALGERMRAALLPLIPGPAARVAVQARVSDCAPAGGSLLVEPLAAAAATSPENAP